MWSSLQIAVIVSMAGLIAVVSAIAGALGCRLRTLGRSPMTGTIQAWNERLDAIETQVRALTERAHGRTSHPAGPRRIVRIDPAPTSSGTPKLIAVPDLSTSRSGGREVTPALRQRYQEIWDQADAGLDSGAIARASNQPIGQIELILGLRRFGSDVRTENATGF